MENQLSYPVANQDTERLVEILVVKLHLDRPGKAWINHSGVAGFDAVIDR